MKKRKHRGLPALTLGAALMLWGAFLLLTGPRGLLVYVLPAPPAQPTQQNGSALIELYEGASEQLTTLADAVSAGAVAARAQGVNLFAGDESVQATLYAVGEGYFDVKHETLRAGRHVTGADVARQERAIVLDERAALTLFSGDDPIGRNVNLEGETYEVTGVIAGGQHLGEVDEYIAYMPITTAARAGIPMTTVEICAKGSGVGPAILARDTLSAWQRGGSFYNFDKLTTGAAMPLRWLTLFVGGALLLSLLERLNALTWGRVCHYHELLKTRYLRSLLGGIIPCALAAAVGYALLGAATFLLARFMIGPLELFAEWVPEVVVEMSALLRRFWALNNQSAAAVRYVCRELVRLELAQGLLRWGLMGVLLGVAMHGLPFINRPVPMPDLNNLR